MKKIFLSSMVFFAIISSLNAQTTMFTSYSFNVAPKDDQTVYNLYKDYFGKKENIIKGVTVTLFQNHFKGIDDATHEVVFAGTSDAMGEAYDSPSSASWNLFQSELSKYCKDANSTSGTRLSSFGDTSKANFAIQDIILQNIKDINLFKEKFDAHWSKSLPPNTRISLGSINRKNVDGTTNYVLISYKDFKTKFNFKPTNEISQKEYGQAVKELRTYTTAHTRILLGKW